MSLLKTIITTKLKYILQKELSQLLPNTQYVLIDGAFKEDLSFKGNYTGATYEEALLALETAFPVGVDEDYAILNPIGLAPINANWTNTGWEADFENKLENIVIDNISHNIILKLNGSILTADFDLTDKENTLSTLNSEAYNVHITTWAGTFSEYKLLDDFDKKTLYFISDRANLVFLGNKIINGGTPEPYLYCTGIGAYGTFDYSAQLVKINKDTITKEASRAFASNVYNTSYSGGISEEVVAVSIAGGSYIHNKNTLNTKLGFGPTSPIVDYNAIYHSDGASIRKYSYSGSILATKELKSLYDDRSIMYIKGYKNLLIVAMAYYPIQTIDFYKLAKSLIILTLDKKTLEVIGESSKFKATNNSGESAFGIVDNYVYLVAHAYNSGTSRYYQLIKLSIDTLEVVGIGNPFQIVGSLFSVGSTDLIFPGYIENSFYFANHSSLRSYDKETLTQFGNYNLGLNVLYQIYFDGRYLYTAQQDPKEVIRKHDMSVPALVSSTKIFRGSCYSVISTKYKEECSWLY